MPLAKGGKEDVELKKLLSRTYSVMPQEACHSPILAEWFEKRGGMAAPMGTAAPCPYERRMASSLSRSRWGWKPKARSTESISVMLSTSSKASMPLLSGAFGVTFSKMATTGRITANGK